jgi:hypothetical protein
MRNSIVCGYCAAEIREHWHVFLHVACGPPQQEPMVKAPDSRWRYWRRR